MSTTADPDQGTASAAPTPPTGVLDEAAARIASDAAQPVGRAKLEKAAVEGMLDALGDRWSTYYGPPDFSAFNASLEGRYTGVGVWLRQGLDGAVPWRASRRHARRAGGRPAGDVVLLDRQRTR